MFGRRAVVRRGPGLIGTVARTAVIAGTATAVVGAVGGAQQQQAQAAEQKQQAKAQSQADLEEVKSQVADLQAQQVAAAAPVPAPVPVAPAVQTTGTLDMLNQLQQLAQLKDSGALTDAEFESAKARVLQG